MAEFCTQCYIELLDPTAKPEDLLLDKELDICEGCGEYAQTVVTVKGAKRFGEPSFTERFPRFDLLLWLIKWLRS